MNLLLVFVMISGLILITSALSGRVPASRAWYLLGLAMLVGPLASLLKGQVSDSLRLLLAGGAALLSTAATVIALVDLRRVRAARKEGT